LLGANTLVIAAGVIRLCPIGQFVGHAIEGRSHPFRGREVSVGRAGGFLHFVYRRVGIRY
jgi:hypothetical protein